MNSHKKVLGIVVQDDWKFFNDIYDSLAQIYHVKLFKPLKLKLPLFSERVNRTLYNLSFHLFINSCNAIFFEWAGSYLAHASSLPKKAKIITRLHSYELTEYADQINWNKVDNIIFVSHKMEERFLTKYPKCIGKSTVINNGVDITRFVPRNIRPFQGNIGILGNLTPRKRSYDLILALAELRDQGFHFNLHIGGSEWPYGDGKQYFLALKEITENLNMKDFVYFHGAVKDTDKWLHQMDVIVSNSYWEGQQVALLEGMASACYCLSHCWSGAEEILPEENIFKYNSELQKKLIDYSLLPIERQEVKCYSLRAIVEEKFNVETMKTKIGQTVNEVISK